MYIQKRNGKRLTHDDRVKIEALFKNGLSQTAIADYLSVNQSTISRELKNGKVTLRDYQYRYYTSYSADVGQQHADWQKTSKGAPTKIGNNFAYLEALEKHILNDCSPQAAIEKEHAKHDLTLSKVTVYRYIALGYFKHVTYASLPQGRRKKRKGKVRRRRTANPLHRSIEERSKEVNTRATFGHWELDSIIGTRKGKRQSCLVLSERKTREEIILRVKDKTAEETVRALTGLKRYFGGDFERLFKTITCDNGTEFADQQGIDATGAVCFYCHPNAPSERGTNENINKLIRRKIPKGKSMYKLTQADATKVQHWVNNYPRPIFGGKTSNDIFAQELAKLDLTNEKRIKRFFEIITK